MVRKFGKTMLLIISIVAMTSICFAETVTEKTVMTLDEAIEYAMKNNANIVDLERMEEDQEDTYEKAEKAYKKWQSKTAYSFNEYDPVYYPKYDYLEYHGYYLDLAKIGYDSFLASQNTAKSTVRYSVMKLAYTITELEDTVKCLEQTIVKQENDVKVLEVKLKLNMATQLDLDAAKSALKSSKLQLETLKSSLDTMRISLKSLIGFDVLKELEIELPEFEFALLEIEDINKTIENSIDTNSNVLAAKLEYKQKEINNVLATTLLLSTEKEVNAAKDAFSDAELRLNNSINATKENLLILYRQIKTNEQNVVLAKEDYEQLQQKYVQMEKMYELNMLTKNDYQAYQVALINAENTYNSAIHENILLNERWNIALLVGDVVASIEK